MVLSLPSPHPTYYCYLYANTIPEFLKPLNICVNNTLIAEFGLFSHFLVNVSGGEGVRVRMAAFKTHGCDSGRVNNNSSSSQQSHRQRRRFSERMRGAALSLSKGRKGATTFPRAHTAESVDEIVCMHKQWL